MAPANFAIAALQGFHQHLKEPKEPGGPLRFGFGWLTNFRPEESIAVHHKALVDLTDMLVSEGVVDPQRVFLLGFSQSCALNYRFVFTHPGHLRGVVGICGGIPGDWEASEIYKPTETSVFHLAGTIMMLVTRLSPRCGKTYVNGWRARLMDSSIIDNRFCYWEKPPYGILEGGGGTTEVRFVHAVRPFSTRRIA